MSAASCAGWMPFALKPITPRAAQSSTSFRMRSGVSSAFFQPGRAAPKVRTRAENPRADLLAALDAASRGHHALGVDLTGRERRRDAVAKIYQRVGRVLSTRPH